MTDTTNLKLTYLETGQKDKSTTINENYDKIDLVPQWLGDLASDPAIIGVPKGSTYYNTTSSVVKTLRDTGVWV